MPIFEPDHPFIDEAVEYQIITVALISGVHLAVALEQVVRLADIVNVLLRKEPSYDSGLVTLPAINQKLRIPDGRGVDIVTLYHCDKAFEYISGQAERPSRIRFSVRKNHLSPDVPEDRRRSSNSPPPPGKWKVKNTGSSLIEASNITVGHLIGGAFESVHQKIKTTHGPDFRSWPAELQFFRHIRHGCFHRNEFSISGHMPIDVTAPPRWHTYSMPDPAAMNGNQVVGGFFPRNQILPFLFNMGNII